MMIFSAKLSEKAREMAVKSLVVTSGSIELLTKTVQTV